MILFLLACGRVSNDPFAEDATYLAALPSEAHHTVTFKSEAEAVETPPDPPRLLELSAEVSDECNAFILSLLRTVDWVRKLPPSERGEQRRAWGPYDYLPDLKVGAVVERTGEGAFDWSFLGTHTGETETSFLSGSHYAGASVAAGDGQFTWNQTLVSQWTGDTRTGTLTVDYDNREGTDLLVDIAGFSDRGSSPYDARYRYVLANGIGDFQYRTRTVLGWDDPATVEVRTRWVVGEGGRSDARITGNSGAVVLWSQCWDGANILTYAHDDHQLNPDEGSESACIYPSAATVDGL